MLLRLKKTYWWLREEAWEWNRYFIFMVPGLIGRAWRGRWLKKNLGSYGGESKIAPGVWISDPKNLHFGHNVGMSRGIFITAGGGIWLHDNISIGPDCMIWSVNHKFDDPDKPVREQGWEYKKVVIEEDVWLGACCIIKPGVTIGKGAVISAGTILSKSVPPFSIVAGNPGRVVGWRKKPEGAAAPETGDAEAAKSQAAEPA
jgi:acetyltransferase-like isoleucine patch superfamily enzyme